MRSRLLFLVLLAMLVSSSCGTSATGPSETAPGVPSEESAPSSTASGTVPTDPPVSTTAPGATRSDATVSTTGAEAAAPVSTAVARPPLLEVTYPPAGEHVTERVVDFRGATDPGCSVTAAGRYSADVAVDGTWSVKLVLRPGGNVGAFEASDPDGAVTRARVLVYYDPQLALRGDGLGPIDFGTPTADAVRVLEDLLGPPSPGPEYPYGGHPLRHVYWDEVDLAVVFSDYEFYRSDGVEHLAGWTHGPGPGHDTGTAGWMLETSTGIRLGSTLADLRAAYGDAVVLEEAPCDGPPMEAHVNTAGTSDRGSRLLFWFDRETSDDGARIVVLFAGAGPGC